MAGETQAGQNQHIVWDGTARSEGKCPPDDLLNARFKQVSEKCFHELAFPVILPKKEKPNAQFR